MEDYTAEMIRDMAFSFCPQCGTAIVPNHKGRPRKFCSPECRSRWNNTHPKPENWKTVRSKICPVCGKPVLQKVGGVRRFCSKECKDEYERKHYKSLATGRNAICQNCGREFKAVHECNGQRRFCSRECYFEFRYGLKGAKQDE